MKRVDRASGLARGDQAISPLLVQEGEVRMPSFQMLETRQCLRNPLQTTLVGRNEIEDIALGGKRCRRGLGGGQCLGEALSFAELADARDLELGRCA